MFVDIYISPETAGNVKSGSQWILFTDRLPEQLSQYIGNCNYALTGNKIIHINLLDIQSNCIGVAEIDTIYNLHYKDKLYIDTELTNSRLSCIKHMYIGWCIRNKVKPNLKEGWFKSENFNRYKDEIGFFSNYGIELTNIRFMLSVT